MAHIAVHDETIDLDHPVLVEGFPGVGLVGKIAADHLVDAFEMTHYATCHCDGLPEVAIYHEDEVPVTGPVRIYADERRDLLVLQSDVPVSPQAAGEFAGCATTWLDEQDALPIYLSGRPVDPEGERSMFGVTTGDAETRLDGSGIDVPDERGAISGPTGAFIYEASRRDFDSIGIIVEVSSQFPDPAAANVLIHKGIEPIAGIEVETDTLLEKADEIRAARRQLAQQMQQASDESSKAEPVGMYQ